MEQSNELNNVMDTIPYQKARRKSPWEKQLNEYKRKLKKTRNTLLLIANFLLALITLSVGCFTYKYYRNQTEHASTVEKYQEFTKKNLKINKTMELLNSRDEWYKDYRRYENEEQLNIALSWDGYIKDETTMATIWKNSSKEERLNLLLQNMAVRNIFAFFEKVKMLHKKDQIDLDYFYNDIFYSIVRMEKIDSTIYPSVSAYLNAVRNQYGFNPDLFDGYEYCRDSIINYQMTLASSRIYLLEKDTIILKADFNPVDSTLNVQLERKVNNGRLVFFDTNGKIVLSEDINNTSEKIVLSKEINSKSAKIDLSKEIASGDINLSKLIAEEYVLRLAENHTENCTICVGKKITNLKKL